MRKDRNSRGQFHLDVIAGLLLFVVAACFSASLLAAALGFDTSSAVLGQMILDAYGLCSTLVPAFLFVAGTMCFLHKWNERAAVRLVTACVPFFTMVATESTCRSICALGMDSFTGAKISITVALGLMLVVIEYLGAGIIGDRLAARNKAATGADVAGENTADSKAANENTSQKSFRGAQEVKDRLDTVDEGMLEQEAAAHSVSQSADEESKDAAAATDNAPEAAASASSEAAKTVAQMVAAAAASEVASASISVKPKSASPSTSQAASASPEVVAPSTPVGTTPLSVASDVAPSSPEVASAVAPDVAHEEEGLLQAGGAVITEEEYNALTSGSPTDPTMNGYPDEPMADELKEISWDNLDTKDEKKNDCEVAPAPAPVDDESAPVVDTAAGMEAESVTVGRVSHEDAPIHEPVATVASPTAEASDAPIAVSSPIQSPVADSAATLDADFFDIDMNDPDLDEDSIGDEASSPSPIFLYNEDDCDSLIREHSIAKQSAAEVFAQMDADVRRSLGIAAALDPVAVSPAPSSLPLPQIVPLSAALQERASAVKQDNDNKPEVWQETTPSAAVPVVECPSRRDGCIETPAPTADALPDDTDDTGDAGDTEIIDNDMMSNASIDDTLSDADFPLIEAGTTDGTKQPDDNDSLDDATVVAPLPVLDDATLDDVIAAPGAAIAAALSDAGDTNAVIERADELVCLNEAAPRHCERSEAISSPTEIASQATQEGRIAMTENPVIARPQAETPAAPRAPYSVPAALLTEYADDEYWVIDAGTQRASATLKETLGEFHIQAEVVGIRKGPVVTMFELLPAPGVKLSKIVALQDNIALRLAASSVRIVAPIPGKKAVGIEIPNRKRSIVGFREIIEQDLPECKSMAVPVILGKDILGHPQIIDLVKTPHLLIAGATGAGKSVCVNSIILSILYKRSPQDVKLILIDPKVVELKLYNDIPHLLVPVITETKKALQALQWALCEMERRYSMLDRMGCREIASYNKKIVEKNIAAEKMPYIIIIIDEFADLMATSGKELESTVARLAAMSRAVGIHLALATQRPSIDVITGLIKANIPSRIAFMVASKTDSRIIIDQVGAEKLLGKGDMLYASAVDPYPTRIQGTFVSDQEVENVVDYIKQYDTPDYIEDEVFVSDDDDSVSDPSVFDGEDPLYDEALQIVVQAGKASASYIQRRLKIGYNRAARLVEDMETRGIVGPANGSKPRELVHLP